MARTIQYFIILILVSTLLPSALAQSKPDTVEQDVVIVIPSNTKLTPGHYYQVKIDILGKTVAAQIKVPDVQPTPKPDTPPGMATPSKSLQQPASGATSSPRKPEPLNGTPSESSPPTVLKSDWIKIALAAVVPIILIALLGWVYLKIIRPRKQLQPYREALNYLYKKRYDEALRLLTEVESKLPDRLRRDARFFSAFANLQLNNTQEAEYILNALYRENSKEPNSAYLLAYIRVKGNRYNEAEPVLERMEANKQLDFHHARKLLGIVKFHRALTAFKDGRVDAAGELFEKVQALGDFAGQIPEDLRNRQVVLGTKALFEKDLVEASKQFESLQNAASKSSVSEKQRDALLATAKIGLALVKWLEDDFDGSIIEGLLVEAAKLLDPKGPIELPWPVDTTGKDVVEKLKDLDAETEQPAEKKEINHFLRGIHFLRGMAILRSWGKMDGEAAHKAITTQYESSLARFACSRARDEEFSDVILVVGLLMYYLHKPGSERSQGVDLLQQAQKFGMRDPNAMEIINNRERIERANADAVDKYLQVLDKYLHDDTVRKDIRLALMERLAKYKKIQSWEKCPDLVQARSVEPTLAEVRNRSEILRDRIDQILSSRSGAEEVDRIKKLSDDIALHGQKLYEQAKVIEKEESELLAETGNQLFKD